MSNLFDDLQKLLKKVNSDKDELVDPKKRIKKLMKKGLVSKVLAENKNFIAQIQWSNFKFVAEKEELYCSYKIIKPLQEQNPKNQPLIPGPLFSFFPIIDGHGYFSIAVDQSGVGISIGNYKHTANAVRYIRLIRLADEIYRLLKEEGSRTKPRWIPVVKKCRKIIKQSIWFNF